MSEVAPVLLSGQAAVCRCGRSATRSSPAAARHRARRSPARPTPSLVRLNGEPVRTVGMRVFPATRDPEPLARLVRELRAEGIRKAELAAAWQARAELLAEELAETRRSIETECDGRPWWRRWLWALAPCLAISLVLI